MKGEKERFEEWWAIAMGTSMKGSKYLARNAWIAALWEYGVVTMKGELIESSGEKGDEPLLPENVWKTTLRELRELREVTVNPVDLATIHRACLVLDELLFIRRQPAPSPAPTIKKDLTVAPLPAEVEEAMERVEVWYRHYDLEKLVGQMGGYAKQDAAALAVIRAALAKGVEWERKWAELVETVASRTDQARTMEVKP